MTNSSTINSSQVTLVSCRLHMYTNDREEHETTMSALVALRRLLRTPQHMLLVMPPLLSLMPVVHRRSCTMYPTNCAESLYRDLQNMQLEVQQNVPTFNMG